MNNVRHTMIQRKRNHVIAGIACLFALSLVPVTSIAQSVDDCMSAGTADALNICKSILDNGSRNIDVFWKLSSAQFQNGQPDLADKTLDEALRLYPGNRKLVALRAIIDSEATEQALIARSAQLNQNSLDKGEMKMTCLTKSGEEAIAACRRRLDLTDDDGDRMRARLAVLESQQAPSVAATATEQRPTADDATVVATAPVVEPSTHNTSTQSNEQLAAQARKQAYRQLVTDVQLQLNDLGFNAGFPDGIPGAKTRDAIAEFYSAIGAPINMSINDITLEDLNAEKRKLTVARQLLQQSEQALQQGNTPMAVQRLADAKTASVLLKVSLQYEQQVRNNSIATVTAEPTAPVRIDKIQPQSIPATVQENTPVAPTPPSIDNTQQFAELMGRVRVLQGQIIRKQEESQQNLEQIRNAL